MPKASWSNRLHVSAVLFVVVCGACAETREDICARQSEQHRVFSQFWHTLDERYAVFEQHLKGADWYDIGIDGCAKIDGNQGMSKSDLYDVMMSAAIHLNDGHVVLEADDLQRDDDAWATPYPYYDDLYSIEGRMDAYLTTPLVYLAEESFAYGKINDIGYLSVTSLSDLAPDAPPDAGDDDDHSIDEAAARAAMHTAMAALADTRALIVDLRANEGGWDSVALIVASAFSGPETVAWYEQEREGHGHSELSEKRAVTIAASTATAYDKPVYVLTSGGTFSAGETLSLAMRVRDHVTLVGERTSGHYSDQAIAPLRNGWVLYFSDERYTAADGEVYEGVGTPVDIEVAFDPDELAKNNDVMLAAALAKISE